MGRHPDGVARVQLAADAFTLRSDLDATVARLAPGGAEGVADDPGRVARSIDVVSYDVDDVVQLEGGAEAARAVDNSTRVELEDVAVTIDPSIQRTVS